MSEINIGQLTKENFRDAILFMKYKFPQIVHEQYMREMNELRNNPFWPHQMTPELLDMIKKWANEDDNTTAKICDD